MQELSGYRNLLRKDKKQEDSTVFKPGKYQPIYSPSFINGLDSACTVLRC